MSDDIGIVGLGMVGTAVFNGMVHNGHRVLKHDIKLHTSLLNLSKASVIFVCVPTPSFKDGSCDTSIVDNVIEELHYMNYDGIICIKSTVSIGTTEKLIQKYNNNKICFVPEFLRERCATEDFIKNHDVCVIGTYDDHIFEHIKKVHKDIPDKFVKLAPSEAEAVKYFNNVYNAVKVTFANSFYEVCQSLGISYTNVKNAVVNREHIYDSYLECNDDMRGFGGPCLPKDTRELSYLCENNLKNISFFTDVLKQNSKFKTTVIEGTRRENE